MCLPDCKSTWEPQHRCCGLLCPVSPNFEGDLLDGEGWTDVDQGPLEALAGENRDVAVADDEMCHADGSVSRVPKGLPEPYVPNATIVARHNLTHWPYAPWCEHCVRAAWSQSVIDGARRIG